MKMLKLECKKCGGPILCDVMVLAAQAPVYCPFCETFIEAEEYRDFVPQGANVPDLVKPKNMTDAQVGSIVYRPANK
ncbi:Uncharacterized [Moorella glycerini]|uniref:Uncharacterized protein n=1 Tax=Neomoorella stamsii TaxID=1266720 RepID=A0A9X7J3Q6_9FIRM|nr:MULTISPECIES: hypothetical protein [Moorella]PRR73426.1 hypothetical protein MOST_12740 [Moorella stamsii]CEP69195.1 Uncharacterized [Moorella glycerini]